MPRLTYWPSSSSWAARAAICSRVSAISGLCPRTGGPPLDALLDVRPHVDHPLHVDARGVHVLGRDVADLDEVLDLGDGHPTGGGAQRVEVAGALPVDEVARPVALPGV